MRPGPRTALIVDDERLARKELAALLAPFRSIQVVGEADSAASARAEAERLRPDIAFLDIQMPGASGFELLPDLPDGTSVVFVTAHDEYAVRAFEVNALDYLLKPVHPDRLKVALERILARPGRPSARDRKLEYDDRLFLAGGNRPRFVRVAAVMGVLAAGDYAAMVLSDGSRTLTGAPLREWELRLPPKQFLRIHRNAVVNLEYVERVEPWFNRSYRVHLRGMREPLRVSRRCAARLRDELR
ncbi:MAG: LytTR family DNA-binding domain-containing protein [Bacteroidota bacterium]